MSVPRLRMIGGPNGSGKSTLLADLQERRLSLGFVLNPDLLQREVVDSGTLDFSKLGIDLQPDQLADFVRKHDLRDRVETQEWGVDGSRLKFGTAKPGGYLTSVLTDFIRREWVARGHSFTFETVMSHPSKVEIIRRARGAGYRTYLYFVCTEASAINVDRVANRVRDGGHDVAPQKIAERYERALNLLPAVIADCDRAYLFDNSSLTTPLRFVAEFENRQLKTFASDLPEWVSRALPSIF